MAQRYAIKSPDEAAAYLQHRAVLGPRLVECVKLILAVEGKMINESLQGSPDDIKFRSSMTLFKVCFGRSGVRSGVAQVLRGR